MFFVMLADKPAVVLPALQSFHCPRCSSCFSLLLYLTVTSGRALPWHPEHCCGCTPAPGMWGQPQRHGAVAEQAMVWDGMVRWEQGSCNPNLLFPCMEGSMLCPGTGAECRHWWHVRDAFRSVGMWVRGRARWGKGDAGTQLAPGAVLPSPASSLLQKSRRGSHHSLTGSRWHFTNSRERTECKKTNWLQVLNLYCFLRALLPSSQSFAPVAVREKLSFIGSVNGHCPVYLKTKSLPTAHMSWQGMREREKVGLCCWFFF